MVRFDGENPPALLDFQMTVGGQTLTMEQIRGVFWMIDTYEDGHHLVMVTESDFFGRNFLLKYNYAGGGLYMIPQFGERLALDFSETAVSNSESVAERKGITASRLPDGSATDFHWLAHSHYAAPNCQTLVMLMLFLSIKGAPDPTDPERS